MQEKVNKDTTSVGAGFLYLTNGFAKIMDRAVAMEEENEKLKNDEAAAGKMLKENEMLRERLESLTLSLSETEAENTVLKKQAEEAATKSAEDLSKNEATIKETNDKLLSL